MMEVKARERFGEVLAVAFGIALIGFLGYLVVSQRAGSPNVPPVSITSNGPVVAVSSKSTGGTNKPSQHASPTTQTSSVAAGAGDSRTASAIVSTGQKQGGSASQHGGSGGSLVSKTATLACDTPLKPVLTTVSNVENGLHSLLPLAKIVSVRSGCSS